MSGDDVQITFLSGNDGTLATSQTEVVFTGHLDVIVPADDGTCNVHLGSPAGSHPAWDWMFEIPPIEYTPLVGDTMAICARWTGTTLEQLSFRINKAPWIDVDLDGGAFTMRTETGAGGWVTEQRRYARADADPGQPGDTPSHDYYLEYEHPKSGYVIDTRLIPWK